VGTIKFINKKIVIVGDVMKDTYLYGVTDRISPEAPVPVIKINKKSFSLGGAANVASNVSALGGDATLIGLTGKDQALADLTEKLSETKINAELVSSFKLKTIEKTRLISQNQQLIRVDEEDDWPQKVEKNQSLQKQLFAKFTKILEKKCDAVILSDYDKGSLASCQDFIKLAKSKKIPVLVDPKGTDFKKYQNAFLIKPNLTEFLKVVGQIKSELEFLEKGFNLCKKLNISALLVTKGSMGMTLMRKNRSFRHFGVHKYKEVFDVTGAGDTVLACITVGIASGLSLEESINISVVSAGIAVNKLGTYSPRLDELEGEVKSSREMNKNEVKGKKNHRKLECEKFNKLLSQKEMMGVVEDLRNKGQSIVFTNGCFDILHAGHIHLLTEAKKMGDILIVAINSDKSIKYLKGQTRPVNSLQKRIAILNAITFINFVIPFGSKTPLSLIKKIQPDVLVKGDEYSKEEVIGSFLVENYGGEVRLVNMVKDLSTTKIISRM
tara:strand:+ start:3821 stop:5308 length:1488 start_codon:yes stop_codon:yes gene_type:complete